MISEARKRMPKTLVEYVEKKGYLHKMAFIVNFQHSQFNMFRKLSFAPIINNYKINVTKS